MSRDIWLKAIIVTIKLMMLVLFIWLIYNGRYLLAVQALLLFIGACIPFLMNLKYKEPFPIELHFLWVVLISVHFFFSSLRVYKNIDFWFIDDLAHVFGGAALATLGFYTLLSLDNYKEHKFLLLVIGLFAFAFAVTFGVVWELIEFTSDNVFGIDSQAGYIYQNGTIVWDTSLFDTMFDLIEGMFGAALASILLVKRAKLQNRKDLEKYAAPIRQYLG